MNILSWIFGGGADKIIDTVDKFNFSEEERMKAFTAYQKSTLPQNLARRILAFMVVGTFLLFIICGAILFKIDQPYSEFLFGFANEVLSIPTSVIIGFYFLKRFGMNKD